MNSDKSPMTMRRAIGTIGAYALLAWLGIVILWSHFGTVPASDALVSFFH